MCYVSKEKPRKKLRYSSVRKNKPTSRIGPLNATGGPSWRPNPVSPVSAQRLQANRNGGQKGYIAGAGIVLCQTARLAKSAPFPRPRRSPDLSLRLASAARQGARLLPPLPRLR